MPILIIVMFAYFYKFFSLLFLIGINNFYYFFHYIVSLYKFFLWNFSVILNKGPSFADIVKDKIKRYIRKKKCLKKLIRHYLAPVF